MKSIESALPSRRTRHSVSGVISTKTSSPSQYKSDGSTGICEKPMPRISGKNPVPGVAAPGVDGTDSMLHGRSTYRDRTELGCRIAHELHLQERNPSTGRAAGPANNLPDKSLNGLELLCLGIEHDRCRLDV